MAKNDNNPPPASGIRQKWDDIPQKIRTLIEDHTGAKVIHAETQSGGFSPGVAARIQTADDRTFFLKAIGTNINPTSIAFHRREVQINAQLPDNSFAPRLLWSHDDADDTEWIALLFDNVDGQCPVVPWQADELSQVIQALNTLSDTLTPSPLAPGIVPGSDEHFAKRINGWQHIRADDAARNQLDNWSQRHLDTLCDIEKDAPAAVAGETLVHFDIRADNIVIADDVAWFVDWPHASIGAAWLDVVLFAPSVAMQGGLSPEDLLQQHPPCQKADPDAITAAVASVAGMLTYRALQPAPRGLPTLRDFQKAQAVVTRDWLAQRTGLT
ncbi:MAG: phosphotransferase family protein [Aggregatilineales bacterium]